MTENSGKDDDSVKDFARDLVKAATKQSSASLLDSEDAVQILSERNEPLRVSGEVFEKMKKKLVERTGIDS